MLWFINLDSQMPLVDCLRRDDVNINSSKKGFMNESRTVNSEYNSLTDVKR